MLSAKPGYNENASGRANSAPKMSYKRECQEKYLPIGSNADLFLAALSPTV
jgi:hypothetical protein